LLAAIIIAGNSKAGWHAGPNIDQMFMLTEAAAKPERLRGYWYATPDFRTRSMRETRQDARTDDRCEKYSAGR
jgi:hypothetical protein